MYKKILIASDGSDEAQGAAEAVVKLGFTDGAEVLLMGALDVSGVSYHGLSALNEEEMQRVKAACRERNLEGIEKCLQALGLTKITSLVVEQTPAVAISETAKKENVDLVVMGRRGLGAIRSFFLGSVSLKVLELCEKPVLVVPKNYQALGPLKTIIAPTDFSKAASMGILHAVQLAKSVNARLVLVHNAPSTKALPEGLPEEVPAELEKSDSQDKVRASYMAKLEEIAKPLRDEGATVICEVHTAGVAQSIVSTVKELDAGLIVMSSHGRSGVEKLFVGSFAVNVVKQSPVPVLVVMQS
jgi:nucleotide-binding universal stress UspA family protein